MENKLIVLKSLANEIEDSYKTDKKWVSVIDPEGNAEIYFKYQGTSVFSILEKEVAPENLCRSLLTMVKYPRTLTINYLDLPYNTIFNEQYFPEEILDVKWVMDWKNIEKLRQNFLQEFPEEIYPCEDFKMCFLFKKDNVPELLHKKTNVLEIVPPSEIEERREKQEAEREARKAQEKPQEEERKSEEPAKTDAKKAVVGNKSSSTAKTSTTTSTVKTTAKASVSVTTKAGTGTTTKTTTAPVKTTTTTGGKTATGTAKTSVTTKVAAKK